MQIWKDNFYKMANAPLSRQFVQTKHAGDANLNYSVLSVSLFNPSSCTPIKLHACIHWLCQAHDRTLCSYAERHRPAHYQSAASRSRGYLGSSFPWQFLTLCVTHVLPLLSPRVEVLAPLCCKRRPKTMCMLVDIAVWCQIDIITFELLNGFIGLHFATQTDNWKMWALPAVLMGNKRASRSNSCRNYRVWLATLTCIMHY